MKFRIVLPLLAAFSCALTSAASAANYLVLNNLDSGTNSLRAAVQAANASPGLDTISFNYTGTITLTSGEIPITESVTIIGPGPGSLTVSGNSSGRIFSTRISDTVAISGIKFIDGLLTGNLPGSSYGGAIFVDNTTGTPATAPLTIDNCYFSHNAAYLGGVLYCNGAVAKISNTTLINNTAANGGGVVWGGASFVNCLLTQNSANTGGAIYGSVNLESCQVVDNTANIEAGGIRGWNASTYATVNNSTISDNTCFGNGVGGISYIGQPITVTNSTFNNNSGGFAGAMWQPSNASTKVVNCTFVENTASGPYATVGGIYEGGLTLRNVTFKDNSSSGGATSTSCIATSGNSTFGNTLFYGASPTVSNPSGTAPYTNLHSDGYNMFKDTPSITLGTADQTAVSTANFNLGPLADNGGPTKTVALKTTPTNSLAIDAGDNSLIDPVLQPGDQRGPDYSVRIYNGTTDIGAYENGLPAIVINNAASTAEGTSPGAAGSATFTVTLVQKSISTITVNYATANGAAIAGTDYVATSGTLTFLPGEKTKTVTVNYIADSTVETNEPFFVNLSSPSNGYVSSGHGSAVILNDDGPVLTIDDAVSVAEGNSGTTAQTFTIHLSMAAAVNVTVKWRTADDTAMTTDSDYTGVPDTVITFTPGQVTKTVTVQVTGDSKVEPNELYHVILSGAGSATIFDNTADATITNDD